MHLVHELLQYRSVTEARDKDLNTSRQDDTAQALIELANDEHFIAFLENNIIKGLNQDGHTFYYRNDRIETRHDQSGIRVTITIGDQVVTRVCPRDLKNVLLTIIILQGEFIRETKKRSKS